MSHPNPALRLWLRLDGGLCLVSGGLQLALPGLLAGLTGLPAALLVWTGAALVAVGGLMLVVGEAAPGARALVGLIALGNLGWATGALALAVLWPATALGLVLLLANAVAPVGFAWVEWRAFSGARGAAMA